MNRITDKSKFSYIDLFRGWAVLVMIEVHIFNAFLRPEIKHEGWFPVLNFINGMVAPSFIFISGFVFVLSSERSVDDIGRFGAGFRRRAGKIALIFFTGYLVHIPFFSLRNNYYFADELLLKSFYNVDVLQCIGTGLLLMLILRTITGFRKLHLIFIIILMSVFVFTSPFIWKTDFSYYMPLPIACYFNEMNGSFFPIFPWLGFLFAGAAIAIIINGSIRRGVHERLMKRIFITGIVSSMITFPLVAWLETFPWFEVRPSPIFFMQRLGVIFVLLYLFRLYYIKRGEGKSFLRDIGRESLLVYLFHLLIIYRVEIGDKNIYSLVGGSFNVLQCALSASGLIALMAIVAILWGIIKKKKPELSRIIFRTAIAAGFIMFCIT